MSAFKDPAAAQRTLDKIGAMAHRDARDFLLAAAEGTARPDQALSQLERWLSACTSPSTMLDTMTAVPDLGSLLVELFGASHQLADVLVQNPELADLVLDPAQLASPPDPARLHAEVRAMLDASTSFSHSLDRLRFAKQSWHLRIAAADLACLWPEDVVWKALSDVADALVSHARDVVWANSGSAGTCPISVIAMGKLGGQELNFSSDIDLVYVLNDDAPKELEKPASRACEALTRALTDRMGRGALYRVDLRLRPYGASGPIAPTLAAVEGYYGRYAEPWEHLALVRSRPVAADPETTARWNAMRDAVCFQRQRGEWFVQDLLHTRARIEERHDESDLKRGVGGIRDIEFLVQILQLLHADRAERLKTLSTLAAIEALDRAAVLPAQAARDLEAAYVFLRQVEHRLQLLGDQQTHRVPQDDDERASLARRTGFASLDNFDDALAMHRANARNWYLSLLQPSESHAPRDSALARAGHAAPVVAQWMDAMPESATFYGSLLENESSMERVLRVAHVAPAVVPQLRQHVSVTEQVLSGEVLEPHEPALTGRPEDARAFRRAWLRNVVRWVLDDGADPGHGAAELCDLTLGLLVRETGLRVVALGSYGAREMSLYSDLDVVFWKDGPLDHEHDERQAQSVLAAVQAMRRAGAPLELDLRLRPEGKKGRLVHNEETLFQYSETVMEPWERLALGRARAHPSLPRAVTQAAFGRPLDHETLERLKRVKKRVESERVPVQHRRRHIKLGAGAQDDVLWTVGLLWWHSYREERPETAGTPERLAHLQADGAINALEREELGSAFVFFRRLRLHLALLGYNDEVLPENPDKLARLAAVLDIGEANDVLARYERHCRAVRGHFESTLERLGG